MDVVVKIEACGSNEGKKLEMSTIIKQSKIALKKKKNGYFWHSNTIGLGRPNAVCRIENCGQLKWSLVSKENERKNEWKKEWMNERINEWENEWENERKDLH